jgi:hypothetical protein
MRANNYRLVARRSLVALMLVLAMAASLAAPALAAWTTTGVGGGAGAAFKMPAGNAPSVSVSGADIEVSWPAATFADGTPVAGYVVERFDAATGQLASVGPDCSGVLTSTACTEIGVPQGNWVYSDTPVQLSWTGLPSPPSPAASVGPATAP